jgi:glutamate dehydrogenase (NAD(P)+)
MLEIQRRSEAQLLQTARHFFDEAAARLGLETSLRELLRYPKRKLIVGFPLQMDSGEVCYIEGYRVQHHAVMGPCKGGVRYHPEVTLEEIEALAILATWEAALLGVPLSGAKGGVRCDPQNALCGGAGAPHTTIHRRNRSAARPGARHPRARSVHRRARDGLDARHPQYARARALYGSGGDGQTDAVGRLAGAGCGERARRASHRHGSPQIFGNPPSPRRESPFKGFGNAGTSFARLITEAGAKVIAVSDSSGGVLAERGLDILALIEHKRSTGSVRNFPGADPISNDELLTLRCDLLVPAAIENQLTEANAGSVKARAILEIANGPTTLEADRVFHERGILVVPDILANAGGMAVSYLEWVQGHKGYSWGTEHVERLLYQFMSRAYRTVQAACERENTDLRTAAYCVALDRVATAARARGLYA